MFKPIYVDLHIAAYLYLLFQENGFIWEWIWYSYLCEAYSVNN